MLFRVFCFFFREQRDRGTQDSFVAHISFVHGTLVEFRIVKEGIHKNNRTITLNCFNAVTNSLTVGPGSG